MIRVLGIKIFDRIKEAGLTQGLLSRHAPVIATRLGFHEVTDDVCSREAFIVLHLIDDTSDTAELIKELQSLGGIAIREITFTGEDEIIYKENPEGIVEILAILVERSKDVIREVQNTLTDYGCNIRTRLGVNEMFFGEPAGLIILELKGDQQQRIQLVNDLKVIKKVHVRTMAF
jgi:hypothetical protein